MCLLCFLIYFLLYASMMALPSAPDSFNQSAFMVSPIGLSFFFKTSPVTVSIFMPLLANSFKLSELFFSLFCQPRVPATTACCNTASWAALSSASNAFCVYHHCVAAADCPQTPSPYPPKSRYAHPCWQRAARQTPHPACRAARDPSISVWFPLSVPAPGRGWTKPTA